MGLQLPKYIGVNAYGIKLPVIQPGDNISELVYSSLERASQDGLLHDNSIVCVTESVVARSQNNYIRLEDIANDVRRKLDLDCNSKIGVLFPIASRNRFSAILSGIARAVPDGEVWVQFPEGKDEVGNVLTNHPATGVDYIKLYNEIIKREGATPHVFQSKKYCELAETDGIVVSSIHDRIEDCIRQSKNFGARIISLQDICNSPSKNRGWSEYGVLGSNLSQDRLKLAPRNSTQIALELQTKIKEGLNKDVQVMIYGDGAYKDPSTGIFELADPVVSFGNTPGLENPRTGVKYKYLADKGLAQGLTKDEVQNMIEQESKKTHETHSMPMEGTTPRPLKDIAGTLADLVSGSADAGTPVVLINGLYSKK